MTQSARNKDRPEPSHSDAAAPRSLHLCLICVSSVVESVFSVTATGSVEVQDITSRTARIAELADVLRRKTSNSAGTSHRSRKKNSAQTEQRQFDKSERPISAEKPTHQPNPNSFAPCPHSVACPSKSSTAFEDGSTRRVKLRFRADVTESCPTSLILGNKNVTERLTAGCETEGGSRLQQSKRKRLSLLTSPSAVWVDHYDPPPFDAVHRADT